MANELTVDQLIGRNKAVAESHEPIPYFSELASHGLKTPNILLLTCVDPRCSPEYYLNMKHREGVLVIRNVCGHVAPVLNDIMVLDRLLNLSNILIVHHTDCGALLFKDDDIREELKKVLPKVENVDSMTFGAITDIEQSVKDDLAVLASAPFIRKDLIARSSGFVYDIKTGKLTQVVV